MRCWTLPKFAAAFPRPFDPARPGAPAIIAERSRPLRVALCVSGQLRGYKEAFPSWPSLGLDDHQVTTFVHTWQSVGQNWTRTWDFLLGNRPLEPDELMERILDRESRLLCN